MINAPSGLWTDLYELTMAAAYWANDPQQQATFELFIRSLPPQRGYLIAAGLEPALAFLQAVRFSDADLEFLRRQPVFAQTPPAFFDALRRWRFSGSVWAMPEGTPVFANEPILRVTAPIIEAQIVETYLLATINFQTLIATKATRVVTAAAGRPVIEFGTRRAHGFEAGVLAARAAYIGGCAGTSNVESGRRYGIPIFGTLAHSFVMSFADEQEAFAAFLRQFPATATILVDTYDPLPAVAELARRFAGKVPAVRLDSGDLERLSRQVRHCLDAAGCASTRIFASGDLNEYRIRDLVAAGAPIDAFGVGTELATSADAPALGGVYKLVACGGRDRLKLSSAKATHPGAKQVWRQRDAAGVYCADRISAADEAPPGADWLPLLEPVMKDGTPLRRAEPLAAVRDRAAAELARLPAAVRALDSPAQYPVGYSSVLEARQQEVRDAIRKRCVSAGGFPE